ncbi:TonB-dependent siderophore receptor [Paucibacter sp. PLA-PC-4]|uniref:TonB-dependent siderophore receptor n=1 Tax=Paucibacter sp. PLA-PC-4 TaxID=2993655 RepID=UPI0022498AA8|nr:TonB-dependent siderophore receptor [Paucibacter sp. PLA-PC-4]MCX2863251.1 TonB-dependent siderophore receptor [Paucibacter sp. PLA-PC-4]
MSYPDHQILAAALSLALLSLGTARAADTEADLSPGGRKLEKVVVNGARKTLEAATGKLGLSARETPQLLSIIDRERIELESLTSIDAVLQNVTGINVTFYDTQRPLYYARGFQITDFQVDGVPTYSGGTNQEYDTALYERIEVLRGANGLLSGAGNPSATVNMLRKRAHRSFEASVVASLGSWNQRRLEGDLNLPLTADGRVRSRFVTALQQRDSFRDRYSERKTSYMGVVEADLLPGTTVQLGYHNQDNVPKAPIWGTIPRFAADGSLAKLPRSTSFSPSWTRWSRQSGTAYAILDQRLGADWKLKAIYNRSQGDSTSLRTYGDGYPDPVTGAGLRLLAAVGQSEETRDSLDIYANGRFVLFGRQHELMLGASYFKTETNTPTLSSVAGWSYAIPNINTWDGSAPAPSYGRTGAWRIGTTEQMGLFASARWRLREDLALITGARLNDWETRTDAYNTSGLYTATTGAYKISDEITPYVGLVYDLNSEFSLYASYTDIFRPQNARDKTDNLLAPVLGSSKELGVKAELLDKRLNLSFAVFEAQQDNYAVRDMSMPDSFKLPDGSYPQIGVNGTKSRGFEFDVAGQLSPGWVLNAGLSQTKITRHKNDLIYANLPKHELQLSTSYRLPGAWERLTVGGGLNWQSKIIGYNIPHPKQGTVTVQQKAYALVNLHASYRFNERLSLGLSLRNALDESYWANLDYPNYGDPRSVMLSLRGRF